MPTYRVTTEYDDGYKGVKEFDDIEKAKSYFGNVDERDIKQSILCDVSGEEPVEIARKEGKSRK
jgi:hypothetical protein